MISDELQGTIDGASFNRVRELLRGYHTRVDELSAGFWDELAETKRLAVERGDELTANAAWCLEGVGTVQDRYVRAFRECQKHQFYDGWTTFERAELAAAALGRHFEDVRQEYGLGHAREYIPKFQELFPYRFFFSPGFIKHEVRCSLCNHVITPRRGCGHKLFGLYGGEIAGRVVTNAEMLEISLVERPVQKYSVLFPQDREYNYAVVAYIAGALRSPWHGWSVSEELRMVENRDYAGVERNDPCPCGSGKRFKRCHFAKALVEEVHYQFTFDEPPPRRWPAHVSNIVVHDAKGPPGVEDRSRSRPDYSVLSSLEGGRLVSGASGGASPFVRDLANSEQVLWGRSRIGNP